MATITKIFFIDESTGNGIFLMDQGDKWVGICDKKPDIGDVLVPKEPLEIDRHIKYGIQYKTKYLYVKFPIKEKYIRQKLIKIFGRANEMLRIPDIFDKLENKSPIIADKYHDIFKEYSQKSHIIKGLALYLFENNIEWPRRLIFMIENGIPGIVTELRYDRESGILLLANSSDFPSDKFILLYELAGGAQDSPLIIRLKMIEIIRKYEDDGGHTMMPYKEFYEQCKIKQNIMGVREYLRNYSDFCRINKNTIARTYINNLEKFIIDKLEDMIDSGPILNKIKIEGLSASQINAIKLIFNKKVSIIMGAAGTGKSTVLLHILQNIKEICVLAPTGKAVSRIREGSPRNDIQAMTIHRWNLLPVEPVELIFIDEASMLDIPTFAKFLERIPEDAHLCLMGDPYQLPSVGIGSVFSDIIEKIPHIELDVVFRQKDGSSLMNSIKEVRMARIPADATILIEANTQSDIERELMRLLDNMPGLPMIITPLNSIVKRLTPLVRERVIPNAPDNWTIGDHVIQTVNIAQKDRYNGLTGIITGIKTNEYRVKFGNSGEEQIYTKEEADQELSFAYVITVHKSQGSESNDVIVVLPLNIDCRLLTNRLIYTAVSRAKRSVHVIGPRDVFRRMIKTRDPPRDTFMRKY